jgi:ribosome biogenesis GTPase
VDTPGLSDVGLWGLDPRELVQCFPDLRRSVGQCRFADCRHISEPGCAVRAAAGVVVPGDRYTSYLAFQEELASLPPDWA